MVAVNSDPNERVIIYHVIFNRWMMKANFSLFQLASVMSISAASAEIPRLLFILYNCSFCSPLHNFYFLTSSQLSFCLWQEQLN